MTRVHRYQKKPLVIEAVQWNGSNLETLAIVMAWTGLNPMSMDAGGGLSIPTLEGVMTAGSGDYIIRGIKGEVYPCRADIFEASYDQLPWP